MVFGGPRSSCLRPGAHSARRPDSHNDWTPCRMAWPFVSAGAHAPHSDERLAPTATRGSSHSARRLRSLAFLCSSEASLIAGQSRPICVYWRQKRAADGRTEPMLWIFRYGCYEYPILYGVRPDQGA